MGVLSDRTIRALSTEGFLDSRGNRQYMISPFKDAEKIPGTISSGVSAYGYDFRLQDHLLIFEPDNIDTVIDPKRFNTSDICKRVEAVEDDSGRYVYLPPHRFALGVTVERFCVPRYVITICTGKSTLARAGLYLNVTPFEPEWEGHATIEILNPNPVAAKIYLGEGIGQLIFLTADHITQKGLRDICERSYADKQGKYQNQESRVVVPRAD